MSTTKKTRTKNTKKATTKKDTAVDNTTNLSTELSEINKEVETLIKTMRKNVALIKNRNSGKNSRTRKPKDPNHPKRSRSAYIIFCNANRSKVQKANPELGAKDITRKLAEMWKALNDKKREPFDKEAAADKVRYETEMAAYNQS